LILEPPKPVRLEKILKQLEPPPDLYKDMTRAWHDRIAQLTLQLPETFLGQLLAQAEMRKPSLHLVIRNRHLWMEDLAGFDAFWKEKDELNPFWRELDDKKKKNLKTAVVEFTAQYAQSFQISPPAELVRHVCTLLVQGEVDIETLHRYIQQEGSRVSSPEFAQSNIGALENASFHMDELASFLSGYNAMSDIRDKVPPDLTDYPLLQATYRRQHYDPDLLRPIRADDKAAPDRSASHENGRNLPKLSFSGYQAVWARSLVQINKRDEATVIEWIRTADLLLHAISKAHGAQFKVQAGATKNVLRKHRKTLETLKQQTLWDFIEGLCKQHMDLIVADPRFIIRLIGLLGETRQLKDETTGAEVFAFHNLLYLLIQPNKYFMPGRSKEGLPSRKTIYKIFPQTRESIHAESMHLYLRARTYLRRIQRMSGRSKTTRAA
jgi:hypothetical protein